MSSAHEGSTDSGTDHQIRVRATVQRLLGRQGRRNRPDAADHGAGGQVDKPPGLSCGRHHDQNVHAVSMQRFGNRAQTG